ncbi:tetratricopeptide repeat protein [Chryseobacterium sp. MP_3.2]|uniref:tetratricopeptide repeat protein n=1 Tax=Chryseobacterium sp. MP_3.2 TaxID=3071712 RepID=UPI002E0A9EB9|nr:tetratricopeptide (TPR) repeat protein [Chryseobacterium sp. MP_3.2]
MKSPHYLIIVLIFFTSCKSDKISEKSIELNNKAINAISVEQYSEALKYSEQAIKADEKNYNAYTIKAQMLMKQNNLNEAEKTIQKQLEIKPDFAEGWTFKGLINDLNGNHKLANQDYQKSIELFKERNLNKEFNPQLNDTNIYLSLLLIGDSKSQIEMKKLESKWKINKSAYETMISVKKMGKKELISQMLID